MTQTYKPDIQVDSDHYDFEEYMERSRFQSLWYRIDEITNLNPDTVLNIGKGKGFLTNLLRLLDIFIQTVDIDPRLDPDSLADVTSLPFRSNSFSTVTAFQVLEHLPFELFTVALSEMKRVAKNYIVISIPDARRYWKISGRLPLVREFKQLITLPRLWEEKHEFDGEHYWELGKRNYPLSKIIQGIRNCDLKVTKNYRIFDNPGHHIFILNCHN